MKTRYLSFLLLIIFLSITAFDSTGLNHSDSSKQEDELLLEDSLSAVSDSLPSGSDTSAVKPAHRVVENKAFGAGEKLEFSVNYGFINAGSASLEIDTIIDVR